MRVPPLRQEPGLRGRGVGHRLLRREGLAARSRTASRPARTRASTEAMSCAVDVGDEVERQPGMGEGGERTHRHLRPEVAAADADVDDVAQSRRAPRRRAPTSRRNRASRRAPRGPGAERRRARRRAQRRVQHGAVLGGVDRARRRASRRAAPRRRTRAPARRGNAASRCRRRFFDRSANTSGASSEAREARRDRARTPRAGRTRGRAPRSGRASAAQAGVRSQRVVASASSGRCQRRAVHRLVGQRRAARRPRAGRRSRTCRSCAPPRRRRGRRPSRRARATSPG